MARIAIRPAYHWAAARSSAPRYDDDMRSPTQFLAVNAPPVTQVGGETMTHAGQVALARSSEPMTHATNRTSRYRILLVAPNAYPVMGGLETHLHEIAPRIARAGFDVTVLATDRTGQLPSRETVNGTSVRRVRAWPPKRDYYFAPGLYPIIKNGPWDLVHCHAYQTLVPPIAMFAAIRANIPLVVTFHSGGHGSRVRNRFRSVQLGLLRPLLNRAARLIAVSDFEAQRFPRQLRIPSSKFVTIPNGAAMKLAPDDTVSIENPSLILSIGRLEWYKGHHRVIAALPQVIKSVPSARLRIVGEGPYEADLRRLAATHGVADRVEIRSVDPTDRDGMARLLASAALVTLLSEYEANPVAIMEALAMRRRVLVADTSGLSELAQRGLARAIPLESAPELIAEAIVDQLSSPPPPAFDLPTWDACASRIVDLYRDVLAGR